MKTDIEYAALVMRPVEITDPVHSQCWIEYYIRETNPLHDDGDSRRLEIACHKWMTINGCVAQSVYNAHWDYYEVWGTGDPQAIRAAVFALAVAIGKTISAGDAMEGNDNAG
jgi:hypothetical protein